MLGKLLYKIRLQNFHRSKKLKTALRLGRLPDFLIIGAQKGGTTSLFQLLRSHPDICLPFEKEMHFFNDNYALGDDWYKGGFPLQLPFLPSKMTGESTPHYLFHEQTPARAKSLIPSAKLIVLLRDPVIRTYSHYGHNLRKKVREPLSFEEALAQENQRIASSSLHLKHFSYTQRSIYLPQLQRWLQHFDRDQLLILSSEDFFKETEKIWHQVLQFLELKSYPLPSKAVSNKGAARKPMAQATKEKLSAFFAPHNEALFEFLGRRFDWL